MAYYIGYNNVGDDNLWSQLSWDTLNNEFVRLSQVTIRQGYSISFKQRYGRIIFMKNEWMNEEIPKKNVAKGVEIEGRVWVRCNVYEWWWQ